MKTIFSIIEIVWRFNSRVHREGKYQMSYFLKLLTKENRIIRIEWDPNRRFSRLEILFLPSSKATRTKKISSPGRFFTKRVWVCEGVLLFSPTPTHRSRDCSSRPQSWRGRSRWMGFQFGLWIKMVDLMFISLSRRRSISSEMEISPSLSLVEWMFLSEEMFSSTNEMSRTSSIEDVWINRTDDARQRRRNTRTHRSSVLEWSVKFAHDDLPSPLFLFEGLCHFIYLQSVNVSTNERFFLLIERGGNREDFLQGRMINTSSPSENPSIVPLMRGVKKKICQDCELIALLEDENGIELLVTNKIVNLKLSVRDVDKKVWLPSLPPPPAPPSFIEATGDASHLSNERSTRWCDRRYSRTIRYESEENSEEIFPLANVLS